MLSKEEKELLAKAIKLHSLNRIFNKRGAQTTQEENVWKLIDQEINGFKMLSPIMLGKEQIKIYKEALKTPVVDEIWYQLAQKQEEQQQEDDLPINKAFASLMQRKAKILLDNKDQEDKWERGTEEKKEDSKWLNFFKFFERYGSKPVGVSSVTYTRKEDGYQENRLIVKFLHRGVKVWCLETPRINDKGFFSFEGTLYSYQYKVKNLKEYLLGKDDQLELLHPYQTLCYDLLKVYTDKDGVDHMYKEEYFENSIQYIRADGTLNKFNKGLRKLLRNSKEYIWEDKKLSPIIWIDRDKSAVSQYSFANMIMLDYQYESMVDNGLIKGLDLLTGSTSMPGKRVKVAANFEIKVDAENTKVFVKKVRDLGEEADYVCVDKLAYPCFALTSSKRQNSATMKDSNSLTVPFKGLKRKFSIKF